jgi:hypothetical protein
MESKIERDFFKYVKGRGGLCLKQNPSWYVNIPDRLIILPGDKCFFLEFKAPGETPNPGQVKFARSLTKRHISVYWRDDLEKAIALYEQKALQIPE